MIDTNVKGLLYVSRVVSNWMLDGKAGHIVNIGSIAGKEVYPNGNVYCATKAAVDALSKGMRIDLVSHGIKVTAIHPGAVETEFSEVRFKGDKARAKKVYDGFEPLVANDIAEAIWFAVSRPAHVNINDMLIMPTAQASATIIARK
jgi:NADP-dependent 3-hydroxy acid dehydrogenase YdfG